MRDSKMLSILQGMLFIFVGIISLVHPLESLTILSLFFQLLLVALGVIKLIKALINKNNFEASYLFYLKLFEGLIFIIIAAVFYFNENLSILSFSIILGLWCTYNALVSLIGSFKGRKVTYWYIALILSLAAFSFGLMMTFKPYVTFISLAVLIALYFLCAGIEILFSTVYIERNMKEPIILDSTDIEIIEPSKSMEPKKEDFK
ncbi:DUF308 domain-containing protein [Clostridium sp. MSJ-4]|uniref:DUF308 domain-containing protein n=1 Tax=Clostridium simiarum TaxID=2841506 RepID=A0ABS6EXE1_9CLOT|nr:MULTISPECIES: DUF308 domain-containing protein [Clostridium]MBU5590893.1 DUF308 domain-containing protein [Clostridium simiarum]